MLATVAVGAVSVAGFLAGSGSAAVCVRHPLIVLADVVGSSAVVNLVGVKSPLVLATFSTAVFIVGLILDLRAGVVVLIARSRCTCSPGRDGRRRLPDHAGHPAAVHRALRDRSVCRRSTRAGHRSSSGWREHGGRGARERAGPAGA